MKDCMGNELAVGDTVVYSDKVYADVIVGQITKFTPRKCAVTGSRSISGFQETSSTVKYPWQVIKLGYSVTFE